MGKAQLLQPSPRLSFPDVLHWSSLKSEGRLEDSVSRNTGKRKQNDNLKGKLCIFLHNVLE